MRSLTLLFALLCVLARPARAESFASWIKNAEKASGRGQHARAAECYGNALRLWKKGDGADAKLSALKAEAAAHAALRQWTGVIRDLSEALAMAKGDKELLLRRGSAYAQTGAHRKAVTDLTAAISADIDYKEAYLQRARVYQAIGDKKFAKEDFGHACELGLQEACPKPEPVKKPPQARGEGAAPDHGSQGEPAAPSGQGPGERKPGLADAPACFSFLNKCVDDGDSFGSCVSKLEPCEKSPSKGCCPEACRKMFSHVQEEQGIGEAEAFRQVFRPGNPCLKRR